MTSWERGRGGAPRTEAGRLLGSLIDEGPVGVGRQQVRSFGAVYEAAWRGLNSNASIFGSRCVRT